MKPGFISKTYRRCLHQLVSCLHDTAKRSINKARWLSIPVGLLLLVSIPLEKLLSFLEALFISLANLFEPIAPKYLSFKDVPISLKYSGYFFLGLLASPFSAIFASSAFITTVIVNPIGATKRFSDTCR